MEYVLPSLKTKGAVDDAIKKTEDKVLVLRFGKKQDVGCLQVDDVMLKTYNSLRSMAEIYTVDISDVPIYAQYFDIEYVPATIFFFNGYHIKVDYGSPDHTKFIGPFKDKQDFIDLVETVYRGAMNGKFIVTSPIDKSRIVQYDLIYKNI